MEINLHLRGALQQLQCAFPVSSASASLHSTPWRKPPPVALGVLPSVGGTEDPLGPEETDSAILALTATIMQPSLKAAMLGDTSSFTHVTHPLLQSTVAKTLEAVSMCTFPPGSSQPDCWISYFLYKRK